MAIKSIPGRRCGWGVLMTTVALLLTACSGGGAGVAPPPPVPYPGPPETARFYFERSVYGTQNVDATSDEDRWRALLTGAARTTGVSFAKPFDVAVHQGRVFVSDSVLQAVIALDFVQQRSFRIGDQGGEGDLGKPLGIAVDASGRLYVVDNRLKRVAVYDRDGRFQTAFGGRDVLDRPSGIDVSADGSRAYVVDVGGVNSDNHRIHVFDPRDGRLLHQIGVRGKGQGELNLPRDVAVGPKDLLYVSDGGNFRVQVFTTAGDFVREWGKPGMRFGQFSRPKGIAVDSQGNSYVVDAAFGNFQIFDPEGRLLLFVGRRNEQNAPGVFMLPAGIDVDEDGRIYVIDQYFRKLEIFRPAELAATDGWLLGKPQPVQSASQSPAPSAAESAQPASPPPAAPAAESAQPASPSPAPSAAESAQPTAEPTQASK